MRIEDKEFYDRFITFSKEIGQEIDASPIEQWTSSTEENIARDTYLTRRIMQAQIMLLERIYSKLIQIHDAIDPEEPTDEF